MSLRARLAIAFGVVVAIGITAASTFGYVSTKSELDRTTEQFLRGRARELIDGARSFPERRAPRPRDDEEPRPPPPLPFDPDAVIQTLDPHGAVVATSGGDLPVTTIEMQLAERDLAPTIRDITIDGQTYRMVTQHIPGGGAVQVARSLEETESVLDGLRNRSLLIGVGLTAAAAFAGWLIAARTTKPLRSLTAAAEQIARTQDLDTPVDVERTDEVGRLAASFDEMLAALADSREQQHRLIHDAGHELRTPLTTLRANIELLQRAPDLEEPARSDLLAAIRSELDELNTLFAELIELATDARSEAPFQLVELNAVAERAVAVFEGRTQRQVRATYRGTNVSANGELLERAITNLLSNSDKFSPPDTSIELRVQGTSVVVRDHGEGIPEGEQGRIFDRFYRAQNARTYPGSGLGLAIVQQIVVQHGGAVHATNAPDGGAEVGFTLMGR